MEKMLCVVVIVVLVGVAFAPEKGEAAIGCGEVANSLMPCFSYVMSGSGSGTPPAECCQGVQGLYTRASTTADRQAVCSCLKNVANSAAPTVIQNAANLPSKCGLSIPYQISPSVDCSTVR